MFRKSIAEELRYRLRRAGHSKMRYSAAQLNAYIEGGWRRKNTAAKRLSEHVAELIGRGPVVCEVAALIDPQWYLSTYPDVAARGEDPVAHYLEHGFREGRNPHPLFRSSHYVSGDPDLSRAGGNPLAHYVLYGAGEGRSPHPLFDPAFYLDRCPEARAAGVNPLVHYLSLGGEGGSPTPLFDADRYFAQIPQARASGMSPLVHYLLHGAAQGLSPHPLFDPGFYLATNPDVAARGEQPFLHYVEHGAREQRNPHPLFDTRYYLEGDPDLSRAGGNPLAHYLLYGAGEGRSPHPLFDPAYYLDQHPQARAAGLNLLVHYLSLGAEAGSATPLFDADHYLAQSPQARASGLSPLVHYLLHGAEQGLSPHPLFDPGFYLATNPDVAARGEQPFLHYVEHGAREQRNPHPLFDTRYYLEGDPDLSRAGGNPLAHYLLYGAGEGRSPHPLFDPAFYLDQHPQARAAGVNPLAHYLTRGWRERSDPHPWFHSAYYADTNPDVCSVRRDPLSHYVMEGWREGRDPHPRFDGELYMERYGDARAFAGPPLTHYARWGKAQGREPSLITDVLSVAEVLADADHAPIRFGDSSNPIVSVIIPAADDPRMTLACLLGVSRHTSTHPVEVIIVAQADDDASRAALARVRGARVIWTRDGSAACSAGAEQARGSFVLFLSPGAYVQANWLDELVRSFASFPEAGIVGSALVYPNGRLCELGMMVAADGTAAVVGRHRDPNAPPYSFAHEMDACSAASMLLRRDLATELRVSLLPFNGTALDTIALCARVKAAGLRVYSQPLSRVVAMEPAREARPQHACGMKNDGNGSTPAGADGASRGTSGPRPNGRNRVLMLDRFAPTPGRDANSAAVLETAKLFRAFGYDLVFGALRHVTARFSGALALERIGVQVVRAPYHESLLAYLLKARDVDLVLMMNEPTARQALPLVQWMPSRPRTVLLNPALDEAGQAPSPEADSDRSRTVERRDTSDMTRNHDVVLTYTDSQAELVRRRAPGKVVERLPWITSLTPTEARFEARQGLLMLVDTQDDAGLEAAVHFRLRLWPKLRERIPGTSLRILAARASGPLRAISGEGIEVDCGESLEAELNSARIALAPLRSCQSFKGTIATSIAAGLPTVVTPAVATAMGMDASRALVVAELDDDFVAAVVRLYANPTLWVATSSAALTYAALEWSFAGAGSRLVHILHRAHVRPTFTLSDRIEAKARQKPRGAAS